MFSNITRLTPPRFVSRTLIGTLATVALILSAGLLLVTLTVRDQARQSVVEGLETRQHLLGTLEERRTEDLRTQVAVLAASLGLRTALDTYHSERRTASAELRSQLVATVRRELDELAARLEADLLAARDADGDVLAVAGRRAPDWSSGPRDDNEVPDAGFLTFPSGVFRTVTVAVSVEADGLGSVQVAQPLDDDYAAELAILSGAHTLIISDDRIVATTLPPTAAAALTPQTVRSLTAGALSTLGGEEYAVRPLLSDAATAVYLLDSIDASARPLVRSSLLTMAAMALGAFVLAAIASVWFARTLSRPIERLSRSLSEMTRTRTFDRPLPRSGASLEVDSLTEAINNMMASITTAEAETLSACLDAIRALAVAVEARDPYTSGHSERVSALSVAIGREMGLDGSTLEVLRLGALVHDIGMIGVGDTLLRKAGPLNADEYAVIKAHPTVGSRILRHARFLGPHLPIVELHHERLDGGGYPLGLTGRQIPLLARIVHAADAYDAMTSARAYRPALPALMALAELHRGAGTDFDPVVVEAVAAVLARGDASLTQVGSLDAFRDEASVGVVRPKAAATPDALDEFASETTNG